MEQLTQRNRTNTTHSPGEESSWRTKLRVPYRNITSRMTSGVLRKGLFAWRHSVYGLSTSHVRLYTHNRARLSTHKLRPSRHTQASTPLYHNRARLSTHKLPLSTTPLCPHKLRLSPSLSAHLVDLLVATCRGCHHSLLPRQKT